MIFLKLSGSLIARLDRYVEQKVWASPGKTVTRAGAAMVLLEQALTQAEVEEPVP
jgi:RecB family endonuclease NucS